MRSPAAGGLPLRVAYHTTGDGRTVNMGLVTVAGPVSARFLLKHSKLPSSEWKYERNMDAKLHSRMERNSKRNKIDTNLTNPVSPCDFLPRQIML